MLTESPHLPVAAHHRILAEKLEDVDAGRCTRLIVTMPPQNGKSTRVRQGVAWMMGRRPDRRFIHVGYAQKFAERNYGRRIQRMLGSAAFQRVFGDRCKIITSSISLLETDAGGSYQAAGVDAPITGFGADGIVIDDPLKNSADADSEVLREAMRDWYGEVIQTRLSPEGFIILVMTRWREDDLVGWVMKEHAHEGWETVDFPAILPNGEALWPERYSLEWLQNKRRSMTERSWNALYMQRPTVLEGGILKRQWWQRWSRSEPPPVEHIVLSLDTAFSEKDSADYSAATVWGYFRSKDTEDETRAAKVYDNIILLDAWQGRVDFPDLRAQCKALIKKHEPDTVLIEKKASGQSLIQELRRQGIPVVAYTPDRDKVARAYSVQSIFESDCVWAPQKPFADMVIDQCAAFPTGAHDDLVDCTVQALIRFRQSGRLSLDTDPFDEPTPKEPRKRDFSYYA